MIQSIQGPGIPPIYGSQGGNGAPSQAVINDMYALVMNLWQLGLKEGDLNNNTFLMSVVAKEINQLYNDFQAMGSLDPDSQAILNGLKDTTTFPGGASLASICADIASGRGTEAEMAQLFDHMNLLSQLGYAITNTPPSTGPFVMPDGKNWFASLGIKYSESTDTADLETVMKELSQLQTDWDNKDWSAVAADITALDKAADAVNPPDGYVDALKDMLETTIPSSGQSLASMAASNDTAGLQDALSNDPTVSKLFSDFFSQFQKWEPNPG